MKQSWIIGSITLYMLIISMEMMATGSTTFPSFMQSHLNTLWNPAMANFAGSATALSTLFVGIGTYLVAFIEIIFLWSPTVFAGNFFFFWLYICLPISISFILVLISIARGVHAS